MKDQGSEQSLGGLIIVRPGLPQLRDRLARSESVEQIIGSVLQTDYQLIEPLQFADYSGDPSTDLPHDLVALYEIEPNAIGRNFDFVNGFNNSLRWWNDFLREIDEAKKPVEKTGHLSVKSTSADSRLADEVRDIFATRRQRRTERISWLRDNLNSRFLGAEYLTRRWDKEVRPNNYPADPNAVRAVIRGVNNLYQQITGIIPPIVKDISELIPVELFPFAYTFSPAELGGIAEAKLLTEFFHSIDNGDSNVSLPQILKDKFIGAREEAQTLTPKVPEKGFRIHTKEQEWSVDKESLVGSEAGEIDFKRFPIPKDYETQAQIHLHAPNRIKDGSEESNYLSGADLAILVEAAESKIPIVHGAIGKDVMVVAVATGETRQKVAQTFPQTGWRYVAETINGYARHILNDLLNSPDIKTTEEAKKKMNILLANNLGLNLYFWDYKGDAFVKSNESEGLLPFPI